MKKLLALLLAAIFALGAAACSGGAGDNGSDTGDAGGSTPSAAASDEGGGDGGAQKVRIAWLGMNPDDRVDPISGITYKGSYEFKAMIEEKVPGAAIEFIQIPSDGWIQKMETTIMAGEADIGWYTNQVMATEWFVDHREFMESDPDFSEETFDALFLEGTKKYTRYHTFDYPEATGDIYGLPMDVSCDYLIYDKQILEEWGVAAPGSTPTYAELLEIARQTTGENPVSGKQNYGAYVRPYWCEWLGVGADLYHPISIPDMDIGKLDIAGDVDYIKSSQEVLDYFQLLLDLIACAPDGVTADSGHENWFTADNNIAVMFDTSKTRDYYRYKLAGNTEITDRFIPVFLPKGAQGVSGFPETRHVAVTKFANDPARCWEIVKVIATDKDCLNWIYTNQEMGVLPALVDTEGLAIMEDDFSKARYEDRKTGMLLTDDYWYWREPIQKVFSQLFVGELTAEQAREAFHANVMEWIDNKKKQLGQ